MKEKNINIGKITSLALAIIVAVSFSACLSAEETYAAVKAPGKTTIKSVKASGAYTITVKWKKVKGAKGYQVFRNGKAVKRIAGKNSVSFKDTGLKANTKYSYKVRAYKTYKQKQWYNKKTGKWQKKKPAKKYRGKSAKRTAYKYGKFSAVKRAKTKKKESASSGGGVFSGGKSIISTIANNFSGGDGDIKVTTQDDGWNGSLYVPVDKNVTLSYGNANIYLGQAWTSSLLSQLKAGSSGYEKVTRKNLFRFYRYKTDPFFGFVTDEQYRGPVNQDVYMFDTGDYDKFLIVYVTGGNISKWITNSSVMGKNGSSVLKKGATTAPAKAKISFKDSLNFISSVPKNGIVIGGFESKLSTAEIDASKIDIEVEKRIGMHMINAYRQLRGRAPLKYNKYLAGVDENGKRMYYTGSYTETAFGTTLTWKNQQYGAQAVADGMKESKRVSDDGGALPKGPLSGVKGESFLIDCASGMTISSSLNNASNRGPWGEACLEAYQDSGIHINALAGATMKYIGIGLAGNYTSEHFGKDR